MTPQPLLPSPKTISPDTSQQSYSKDDKGIRKPSVGPPPAYAPRRGDVIPTWRPGPGVRVAAKASPRVHGPEHVQVGVDIRWPDKSSIRTVRRVATDDELKNVTPVKDLHERVKADIEEAMDMKFKKQVEATDAKLTKQEEKWRRQLKENSQYHKNLTTRLCKIQI